MRIGQALAWVTCGVAALFPAAIASQTTPPPHSDEPRVIEVVARRFTFEPALIEATAGERLRILVRSGDGPHGFEIKKFNISKEIPRGSEPVVIEFAPEEAGRFPIVCSLFCGDGHGDMKGALVVSARAVARR